MTSTEGKRYRSVNSLPASNLSINDNLLRKARFFPIPTGKSRSLPSTRPSLILHNIKEVSARLLGENYKEDRNPWDGGYAISQNSPLLMQLTMFIPPPTASDGGVAAT
jgi:hypothetical protein